MKVLFITSRDFGELGLAAIFARNQSFQSVFAVPAQRAAYFDEVVNIMYTYSSIKELERIIKKEVPDVISLNTAYLIINGALATIDEYTSFFQYLKEFGRPIITTDPFVRVYDSYPACSFSLDGKPLEALKAEMTFLSDYLKNLPHIYGFPCQNNLGIAYSFYNEKFCLAENSRWRDPQKRDYWLFVLGELDCTLLIGKHGDLFITEMANRLNEICQNKENFVRCVFPKNIARILREVLSPLKNLQILDFVTWRKFETLVCESNAVFYWNVFSNSILLCYYYNIPFLCFDKGHIANLSPDLFNHMSEGIYCSGKPQFIDFFSAIEPRLQILLQNLYSTENRQRILDEYHRLPSPEKIIEAINND